MIKVFCNGCGAELNRARPVAVTAVTTTAASSVGIPRGRIHLDDACAAVAFAALDTMKERS